jgi:hypothetical protein
MSKQKYVMQTYKERRKAYPYEKCKQAEQELNKMIDFYRDMIATSHYPSGNQTIKDCEESLQYLVDNFNPK